MWTITALICLASFPHTWSVPTNDTVKDYLTNLDNNYDSLIFPRYQTFSPITVDVGLELYSITDYNEQRGILRFSGKLIVTWTDENLIESSVGWYTPQKYSKLNELVLQKENIWLPPLTIQNGMDEIKMVGNSSTTLRVLPNSGYVKWTPKINPSTKCTYDAKFFPFDKQTCVVKLVPWGFQTTEIILTTSSSVIDLSHYNEQTHSQWSVMTTSISNKTIENQSFMEFSIVLHREPSFFIWYTIIPVCAVTLLMYFSFLMPNAKMTQGLKMTFLKARIKNVKKTRKDILSPPVIATRSRYIAVAFLFFAFTFKLNFYLIPHVSNPIPMICYFLIISLVAVGLAAIISVLVMRLDFKPKRKEVPDRLKTIIALILLRYWYPKEQERGENEPQGRQPVQTPGEKRPLTAESIGDEEDEEGKIDYMEPKEGITYQTVTTTLNSCFFMLFFTVSLTFTVLIIITVSVGKDS